MKTKRTQHRALRNTSERSPPMYDDFIVVNEHVLIEIVVI